MSGANPVGSPIPTTPGEAADAANRVLKAAKDAPNVATEALIGGDAFTEAKKTFSKAELRTTYADQYATEMEMKLDLMRMEMLTDIMKSYLSAAAKVVEAVR